MRAIMIARAHQSLSRRQLRNGDEFSPVVFLSHNVRDGCNVDNSANSGADLGTSV